MIRVGIVGFGFMGRMHYRCWKALKDVTVTAICDADAKSLKPSTTVTGNLSNAADTIDLSGVRTFTSYDEMLSAKVTDTVSITLPTNLHPDFTIKALQSGQHVLCEKPMALTTVECDRMIDAAKKSDRVLQIGHCIRFWPEYAKTREIILSGKHGKVLAANFQRFSPMPAWSTGNWLGDEKKSGGMPLDLHIHDTDFVHHLFGMPKSVMSVSDKAMSHIFTTFLYNDETVITAEASWRVSPVLGFSMSFRITLEKATIIYDCTKTPAFLVYPFEGKAFTPELLAGDGYSREVEHFARRIRGENVEEVLTLEQSKETVRFVLAEKESALKRSIVGV